MAFIPSNMNCSYICSLNATTFALKVKSHEFIEPSNRGSLHKAWHCLRIISVKFGSIHQLGERFLAYQTVIVGVGFSKHLQQAVVQLRVAVALLVSHGLLHPPDEVLLGLVEGADGAGAGGHRDGLGAWFLRGRIELRLTLVGRIPSFI